MNPKLKRGLIHSSLFIITFITTTLAGAEWTFSKSFLMPGYGWSDFASGLPYSICFLTILTCHEFGHYFTAVYYRVKATLPFFIPLPPFFPFIGTMGAMIRIKSLIRSTKEHFDIGIAGPLAGLVVAIAFLIYGFLTLPDANYVKEIHADSDRRQAEYYKSSGEKPVEGSIDVVIGKNLLYIILESVFADPERAPSVHEIMHYPYLFAGFFSLIFTWMNLLPIGQLDGGHVLYGLVGYKWHRWIATVIFVALVFYSGLGVVNPYQPMEELIFQIPFYLVSLFLMFRTIAAQVKDRILYALVIFSTQYLLAWIFPTIQGYAGWLVFAFVVGTFIGIPHPVSEIEERLDWKRKLLGWFTLAIFILCFTPQPINIIENIKAAP